MGGRRHGRYSEWKDGRVVLVVVTMITRMEMSEKERTRTRMRPNGLRMDIDVVKKGYKLIHFATVVVLVARVGRKGGR